MARLYLSTDSSEAQVLLEGEHSHPKHSYEDIGIHTGEIIKKRLKFNPMCAVDVTLPQRIIGGVVAKLVREGHFVATEIDGKVKTHFPHDLPERNTLTELMNSSKDDRIYGSGRGEFLLIYSNNPNEISVKLPFNWMMRKYVGSK